MSFLCQSDFQPAGDQPKAIRSLWKGFSRFPRQTLLGVTGSGKTFTLAKVIEHLQKPTLILAHNKTLAAQLYSELKLFFPSAAVCYFVSYYDYYQPESYLPQSDTYIEKETQINEKLDQLRLETITSLVSRPDTLVVSSVSCIYSLGSPHDFKSATLHFRAGEPLSCKIFLRNLIDLLYERNDTKLSAGTFRVRGSTVDVMQGFGGNVTRFDFSDGTIESITLHHPVTLDLISEQKEATLFPAKPFLAPEEKRVRAIAAIRNELRETLPTLGMLEAHRLEQRTLYDLEMIEQLGYCKGIENYSRHFDGRAPSEPPFTLLDFFKHSPFSKDFLLCVDESHVTLPQVRGMYQGDYSRKKNLIDFGFRLPSAFDNRPLKFHEFEQYLSHSIFTSATPGEYERETSGQCVELIVRPTGVVEPPISVRPISGHIQDLMSEIAHTVEKGDRVLVTALTKRSAEELAEYFVEHDVKARYLHSEINTLERTGILRELRQGVFDVLVGINLLREGLDLPEVGLVAILDADKEGFLRNTTSLIQTVGRAARNIRSHVVLYADVMTLSIQTALAETDRRRVIQEEYNKKHGITPRTILKKIEETMTQEKEKEAISQGRSRQELEEEMRLCVEELNFERAIVLRDTLAQKTVDRRKRKR